MVILRLYDVCTRSSKVDLGLLKWVIHTKRIRRRKKKQNTHAQTKVLTGFQYLLPSMKLQVHVKSNSHQKISINREASDKD